MGWDDPPPEVSDLQIHFQDIPEAENACTYFLKTERFLFQNQDDETPSSSPSTQRTTQQIVNAGKERVRELMKKEDWPVEEILPLLEENQTFLALCERGVTCPYLQVPEVKTIDEPIPVAGLLRSYGRLNALRASYLFQTGKETDAFEQAMEIIRFGQRIVNGRGNMIY